MVEDRPVFGITGDWNTAALLDPGAWCSTVCEGGCSFVVAWVREKEKAVRKAAEEESSRRGIQG